MATEQEQEQEQQEQQQEAAPEVEQEEAAPAEGEQQAEEEKKPEAESEPAAEVTTVTIGDAPAEEDKTPAPGWVKEVRQRNRELEKQLREAQKQLQQQGQQQAAQVGKKPEMSDPDIDYDSAKYEAAYAAWSDRRRKAEAEQERIERAQKDEQAAWQTKLDAYGNAKAALKVPDVEDAEALVNETLNDRQKAIIVKGAKNPALLMYALGKNPAKLQEVAKITDLVEFAAIVFRDVEGQLKVQTKKPAPPAPEKKVTGAAPGGGLDTTLDKLRAEAERTGDYTKVVAHKQKKAA